ncbi:MAG: FosX/FosE/FosI family fosfomycin resistance hydrolase [Negativicutes bacterium]|jgi:catechol 2,3-dioxygenase-like lactoylglutathione lyase family enzyme|nr:FosX/FosE/FosI family fosfomycin resistance hydrolase [Negativicutes bacterium]
MVQGISHLTFIVKDLEKGANFFRTIFDAQEIYSSGDATFSLSKEKFFLIGDIWICIMEGDSLVETNYNHVAFKILDLDYESYWTKIKGLGLEIKPERTRVEGEGRSIYFYDYDNHLFELHTGTLQERLLRYKK